MRNEAQKHVSSRPSTSPDSSRPGSRATGRHGAESPVAAAGKHAAARQVLAEVYSQFSEGFDTADMLAAAEQLEALG